MTDSTTSQQVLEAPALVIDAASRTTTLLTRNGRHVATWDASEPSGPSWLAHFGAGVVGDSLWRHEQPIDEAWTHLRRPDLAVKWGDSARGALCLFALWPNGDWAVCPDPVGAAPAYYFTNGRLTIISASIPTLVEVANTYGIELPIATGFTLEVALLANGGIFPTSRQATERTAPFEFLQGQRDELQTSVLPHRDYLFEPEAPAVLLQRFIEDVVTNVSSSLADPSSNHRICQLTGGLDSRVILGAVLHAGLSERVTLYTAGPKGTRDRDIAENLARVAGIPLTSNSGLGEMTRELEPHEYPLNSMHRTGGLSRQGPTGNETGTNSVVLGGLYGMFTHGLYSAKFREFHRTAMDIKSAAQAIYPGPAFTDFNASRSVFSRDFQRELLVRFSRHLERSIEAVPYDDYVLDYFFLNARNRFHAGIIQSSTAQYATRVDPLYSLAGLKLGIQSTTTLRDSYIHKYDVLNQLAPHLLRYPFDVDKFSNNVAHWRRPIPAADWPDAPAAHSNSEVPEHSRTQRPADPSRQADIKKAAEINAPYWQVATYDTAREDINEILRDSRFSLAPMINRNGIQWLLNNGLRNRSYLRMVMDLHSSFKWLATS